jgi:hypothetical protein
MSVTDRINFPFYRFIFNFNQAFFKQSLFLNFKRNMRPFLTLILFIGFTVAGYAQEQSEAGQGTVSSSFSTNTKIISFGIGFPNLYRTGYNEPSGYTHIKTTGFGPFYAKLEFAAFKNVGLVTSFSYSTFHYSYFGRPGIIYYDDVNTLSFSLSGNYHFSNWITNPRLDVYAGGGLAVDYQKYTYGNIPPYKSPEHKAHIYPLVRGGARYYLDNIFGLYGEAGYDGLSVIQLGFSVRF